MKPRTQTREEIEAEIRQAEDADLNIRIPALVMGLQADLGDSNKVLRVLAGALGCAVANLCLPTAEAFEGLLSGTQKSMSVTARQSWATRVAFDPRVRG